MTLKGRVDELVAELADEPAPAAQSSTAVQLKVVATSKVRFHMMERLIANIGRKTTTSCESVSEDTTGGSHRSIVEQRCQPEENHSLDERQHVLHSALAR